MAARTALVTGISGQDGAYLAKLLLDKGYRVVGATRRSSNSRLPRLAELGIEDAIETAYFELGELTQILRLLDKVRPDEIYNLAAQSFVGVSWEQPIYTVDVGGLGVMRLLEGIRAHCPVSRFYQASTSEMFGKAPAAPQDERTAFYPRSPYGIAKLAAHWATVNYRESFGIHASSGILFNHESPLRGTEFVTRKITLGLARLLAGQQDAVELGNLDSRRDWGFAGDYVDGMWRMTQQEKPGDYVLATGETHSIREFIGYACDAAGITVDWSGSGVEEMARDARTGRVLVRVNPAFFRPAEVDLLKGDASKARTALGWSPAVDVRALARMMFEADARRVREGRVAI